MSGAIKTALMLAALATLATLALVLLGRSGRRITTGRYGRLARIGRLSARLWTSSMGAKVRRLFASKERRARYDEERRHRDAKLVTETMGQMKGAVMKLGQIMSFVSDSVPTEYQSALQSLQAAAPPMDFPLIRDVAERELGMPLERAFARFDEEPNISWGEELEKAGAHVIYGMERRSSTGSSRCSTRRSRPDRSSMSCASACSKSSTTKTRHATRRRSTSSTRAIRSSGSQRCSNRTPPRASSPRNT